MDDAQKLKIAMALVKDMAQRGEGIKVGENARRKLGELAKRTGLPIDELTEFIREVALDLVKESYSIGTEEGTS